MQHLVDCSVERAPAATARSVDFRLARNKRGELALDEGFVPGLEAAMEQDDGSDVILSRLEDGVANCWRQGDHRRFACADGGQVLAINKNAFEDRCITEPRYVVIGETRVEDLAVLEADLFV